MVLVQTPIRPVCPEARLPGWGRSSDRDEQKPQPTASGRAPGLITLSNHLTAEL